MRNIKVSIIIPIYKSEKYLSKCIDSIIAQEYSNWEILLIDDGSPDKSGEICDEYAKRDNRIKVFHKENGGVSSARNLGLDNIEGDYVTFVDSDDWLSEETLTLCSSYFDKYEIIRFSMVYVESLIEDNNRKLVLPFSESKNIIMQRILGRNSLLGVCGGLYKADLFNNLSIRFDSKFVMAEDWLVLCQLVSKCHNIIDLPNVCYCYNKMNEDSCSNNPSIKKVEQCFIVLDIIWKEQNIKQLYSESLYRSLCILTKSLFSIFIRESQTPKQFIQRTKSKKYLYDNLKIYQIIKAKISIIDKMFLCMGCTNYGKFILAVFTILKKIVSWVKI